MSNLSDHVARHVGRRPGHCKFLVSTQRTDLRTFVGLLGRLPSPTLAEGPDLAVMVLTLNDGAFARLLAYTGLAVDNLIKGDPFPQAQDVQIARGTARHPHLVPANPRHRLPRVPYATGRRARRHPRVPAQGSVPTPRVLAVRQGGGQRLDLAAIPEVAAAQRRLDNMANALRSDRRHARLRDRQRLPPALVADRLPPALVSHPGRSLARARPHGRCSAHPQHLATPRLDAAPRVHRVGGRLRQPVLAVLAIPTPDRRHRLFYQRLLAELAVNAVSPLRTMRTFDPLPRDIQDRPVGGAS